MSRSRANDPFNARRLEIPGNSRDITVHRGRMRIPRASNFSKRPYVQYMHARVRVARVTRFAARLIRSCALALPSDPYLIPRIFTVRGTNAV